MYGIIKAQVNCPYCGYKDVFDVDYKETLVNCLACSRSYVLITPTKPLIIGKGYKIEGYEPEIYKEEDINRIFKK